MEEPIVNKVAKSPLITIDMEKYCDPDVDRAELDIKDNLYEGMILREKDFRSFIKETDWSKYKNKYVAVYCSVDAIVPTWAYMLLTSALQPYARLIHKGNLDELNFRIFREKLDGEDLDQFREKRLVIKGCGDFKIPDSCYVYIMEKLQPIVLSIMYGEPCSTVPIFKRKKIKK